DAEALGFGDGDALGSVTPVTGASTTLPSLSTTNRCVPSPFCTYTRPSTPRVMLGTPLLFGIRNAFCCLPSRSYVIKKPVVLFTTATEEPLHIGPSYSP